MFSGSEPWRVCACCQSLWRTLLHGTICSIFRSPSHWVRTTPFQEDHLLDSVCRLRCDSHLKCPRRGAVNNITWNILVNLGTAKLTHEIKHHNIKLDNEVRLKEDLSRISYSPEFFDLFWLLQICAWVPFPGSLTYVSQLRLAPWFQG